MRRFVMPFMAIMLVAMLALSACGGFGGSADGPPATPTPEAAAEATPTPTPTPEPTPEPVQESEGIVGVWAWDALNMWQYDFNADGTGIRGVGAEETFTWRTEGDNLLIETDLMEESWTFVIEGDMMTLTSRQAAGMEYSYIRVTNGNVANVPGAVLAEGGPVRGGWSGDVYTSEYLSLSFTLPAGWHAHSDAEIAAAMGMAANLLGDAGAYLPADLDVFTDMTASNPATGANVQILFERLPFAVSIDEYIEISQEGIEFIGGVFEAIPGTTRIGNYDWRTFATELDFGGFIVYGRQFVDIQDGYVRSIIISYMEGTETPEEILPMFEGI